MENLEVILSISGTALGLFITTLTFLSQFIKNAKAKKVAENIVKIGNAMIPFIEKAETFANYSGEEKKQYVMTKANQYAIDNNIVFDAAAISEKIEELVSLTKQVNKPTKDVESTALTYKKKSNLKEKTKMGRFEDYITNLDAETLNGLEDDLKDLSGIPVFEAEHNPIFTHSHVLRINNQHFLESLKIGFTFIMMPKESTQGSSGLPLEIGRDGFGDPLFWNGEKENETDGEMGYEKARVHNVKYLRANRPYIIKCFDKVGENFQFLITEIYRDIPASQTGFGSVKVWTEGSTLNISTQ